MSILKVTNHDSAFTSFGETVSATPVAYIEGSTTDDFIPTNFRGFAATGGSTGGSNINFDTTIIWYEDV